ncbi:tetratricopeptide tPR2 repeat protein [Bifidobacterium ramosum]|uniref:DUF4037 domain-containing protein n=1 Tax=Bifidobacterium ramosum TaxID=1798158 RepID=A0A6L4X0U9_9BIFI|nr:DUF4037 domain-containing protein [Bifidobacterium ramosum]KAB8288059.1 tetratricopeptide tPR2 repeat protein [Bifidobacterium ramosum]NEG72115.1 DUF4037 domain-containing protein [Bifidobacterium ramosum]
MDDDELLKRLEAFGAAIDNAKGYANADDEINESNAPGDQSVISTAGTVTSQSAANPSATGQVVTDPSATDQSSESDTDQPATFDVNAFLAGLDAIFDAHEAATKAGPYLEQAAVDAENADDDAGLLTVLNETMGFYRSQGKHQENQWVIQRALELAAKMRIEGTDAWTTTLINAATGQRAAGNYDQAEDLYHMALDSAARTLSPTDRRLAALHNNLSMVYSETHRNDQAETELRTALRILEESSPNADADLDVASTHTNLALVLLSEHKLDDADRHAARALEIYRTGHLEHSAHYASALAGYAQVRFAAGDYARAVRLYRQSLAVIEECYGRDTDYYRITEENLTQAEDAARQAGIDLGTEAADGNSNANDADHHTPASQLQPHEQPQSSPQSSPAAPRSDRPRMSGLKLARAYWETYGKPMIAERYPQYQGRIATGLVGHGSECYGFDDAISQDHDFGPRFCLWLTAEDYAAIGAQLQADYDALPREFMGYVRADAANGSATPRAQGAGRRDGVFAIGDFFASITGYREAPGDDRPHEWLMLDESTLAAATNGTVFADPLGKFSAARQAFTFMPDDVRLSLISRRLGMMAQAGQYNVPRMLERGDGAAAWLSIGEFVDAAASLVFLLNGPVTVGYLPYYKWRFAALRRLSARVATRLADVGDQLETLLRLSSAACYGGAGFGEGGRGAAPAAAQITQTIDHICAEVVTELRREGLTRSDETFLEWQRPYVEEHIRGDAACLRSL